MKRQRNADGEEDARQQHIVALVLAIGHRHPENQQNPGDGRVHARRQEFGAGVCGDGSAPVTTASMTRSRSKNTAKPL
jgi:hypothetical protein